MFYDDVKGGLRLVMLAWRLKRLGADAVLVLTDRFPVFLLDIVIDFDELGVERIETILAAGSDPEPVTAANFVVVSSVATIRVGLIRLAAIVDVPRKLGLGDPADTSLDFRLAALTFDVHDPAIHQLSPQEDAVHCMAMLPMEQICKKDIL